MDAKFVYTLSDPQVQLALNSIKSLRRFVNRDDIVVFCTPPIREKNIHALSRNAVVVESENLTEPFFMAKGKCGRYGEKIHLCDVDSSRVVFLDCDTVVKKDPRELLDGDFDFSARIGSGYYEFNQYVWMKMFEKIGKDPIPMPNTGFMIFKNNVHKEIRDEWLKYINSPFLPNPHPSGFPKEQYALALAISGKRIRWMSKKEHAFGWKKEELNIDTYVLHLGTGRAKRSIREIIYSKTRPLRHGIVKLIAPRLYSLIKGERARAMIKFIQRNYEKPLIGAEIGVLHGNNAKSIIETLNIKKLYLIDPYKPYQDRIFRDPREAYRIAYQNLSKYQNRITWILKESEKAINDIPDDLDFVYIHGNHNYEYIKKEIELYFEKVKDGGVLGGNGYTIDFINDVVKAVNEFVRKHDLFLYRDQSDWWVIKGESRFWRG